MSTESHGHTGAGPDQPASAPAAFPDSATGFPAAPQLAADTQATAHPAAGPVPGYPPVPPYSPYPPLRRPTNNLALAALIVGLVSLVSCPLVGGVAIYLGNRARAEIARTGEDGAGFAQSGVIIGWCALGLAALSVLFVVGYLLFLGVMVGTMSVGTP